MASHGNDAARDAYESKVPPFYYRPTSSDCQLLREQWIRAKYERLEFTHPEKQEPYSAGYREGSLWKRGRDNGQFLSRKFVLTEREGSLKYFNRNDAKEPKAVMKIEHLNATFQPAKIGHPHGLQITYLKDNSTRNIFVYHEDGKVGAGLPSSRESPAPTASAEPAGPSWGMGPGGAHTEEGHGLGACAQRPAPWPSPPPPTLHPCSLRVEGAPCKHLGVCPFGHWGILIIVLWILSHVWLQTTCPWFQGQNVSVRLQTQAPGNHLSTTFSPFIALKCTFSRLSICFRGIRYIRCCEAGPPNRSPERPISP
uniref:arf-GAP with dual PH domain-containing protein 1 isoform X1 n=1 Tax=Panthera onca TaxID=9690 RepID=UPI002952D6D6|nr:arf-GAP with dual PH domain-containing protein 1 isoform X1 [Panthera onca]